MKLLQKSSMAFACQAVARRDALCFGCMLGIGVLAGGVLSGRAQAQGRAPTEWFWLEVMTLAALPPKELKAAAEPLALRGTLAMADGVTRSTWGWWPASQVVKVAAARSNEAGPKASYGPYTTTITPQEFRELWNGLAAIPELTGMVMSKPDAEPALPGHTLIRMRYGFTGGGGSRAYLIPDTAQTPAIRQWLARVQQWSSPPAAAASHSAAASKPVRQTPPAKPH